MAKIGLKYPKYAKVTVTESQGVESETFGTVTACGKAISANVSVNASDTKFYADDGVAEVDPEFIDGTISLSVDDMTPTVIADLSGATNDNGTGGTNDVIFGEEDAAPYVRFGFIVPKMVGGAKKWMGIIYLRVKFGTPEDSFQTKGQQVEFAGTTISGTIMKNCQGKWKRMSEDKTTEDAALTWLTSSLAAANPT